MKREKKLDFLVIGTQKGGTTSLDAYLRLHSQIEMPKKTKELHFFDTPRYALNHYSNYHASFSEKSVAPSILRGECTPIYMYWYPSIDRIYDYNPKIKLILILRNPMERAWSHWNMEYRRGDEKLGFSEAIRAEKKRLENSQHRQHRVYSYIDRGCYARQIKRIFNCFKKDQLYITKSEIFRMQPKKVLDEISDFLGVASIPMSNKIELHCGQYARSMRKEDFEFIRDELADDLSALEALLSWNCTSWRVFA